MVLIMTNMAIMPIYGKNGFGHMTNTATMPIYAKN